ncbi:MAG: sodium/proton-translocating pyrophosphatase, partial [Oscillospiraceae bacterium]|nr:sodium/proton-translocating pyrophosphatase [Oscillospiraceae bacterium]
MIFENIENLFWLGYVGAFLALGFAFVKGRRIFKYSEGNEAMVKIAAAIRSGANAYLKRQYEVVAIFFAIMFIILLTLSLFGFVNRYVPYAFVTGGFFTGLSGFIGMKVATYANARTANAASESLNKALRIAFNSGTVMGFTVNGLGLLDITTWYLLLKYVFNESIEVIAMTMVTFGMGIATMAMFARVGGGIFTKAADVGADLVGKVEVGIPEDDPRNPAVIADNVGDNVGDVAGMGADLYEANSNAIVATIAIGVGAGYGSSGLLLPILISVIGVIASLIGTFFVRTKEQIEQKTLLRSLHKGVFVAGILAAISTLPLTQYIANSEILNDAGELVTNPMAGNANGIFVAIILGIA